MQKNFDFGVIEPSVKAAIQHVREETILFCLKSLNKKQCREDYRKLLELTLIFLGETPPCGILFRYPGAFHQSRFMSKATNSLKFFIFRKQYELLPREEKSLQDICIYLVHSYVVTWFRTTVAIKTLRMIFNF